jgi:MFS transporter, NNP family, nitrate/nitrite transporter
VNPDMESCKSKRVLWLSTSAFTLMFSVWLMMGVLGISVRKELGLSDAQLEWLIAVAILAGSVFRLNFGIWADTYGGRTVTGLLLLAVALPTYLVSQVSTFNQLLICAALFGLAGNSFSAGISWNATWFPNEKKGWALGIFGTGNVGAAGTKMLVALAPGILTIVPAAGYLGGAIRGGWRFIPVVYAVLLVLMALAVLFLSPGPDRTPGRGRSFLQTLRPLRHMRLWRFGLYYVVVFGAYVALSGWLPKYYIDTYGVTLSTAALLTATFIFPASLLRPLGGYLSDRAGPRVVTYTSFLIMTVILIMLSIPAGFKLGPYSFTTLLFALGCAMGIGKASVFKYIPDYFPNDVGAAGGVVGALGALGGFILPPVFGWLGRWTGAPQLAFTALLALTVWSLVWLHWTVIRSRSRATTFVHVRGMQSPSEYQLELKDS